MATLHPHSAQLDNDGEDDDASQPAARPSPFEDQEGPLTWSIVAWRAGLILLLAIISLTLLAGASWVVMRMYR
jgi:hypothetical protein